MRRIRGFDESTRDGTNLTPYSLFREGVADERRGMGRAVDLSVGQHGIVLMGEMPQELTNIHDTALNYWDETRDFMSYQKERLPRDTTVHTTQRWVSGTFLDTLSSDPAAHGESDIILAEDSAGRLWVMDGHHRLVHDRRLGRDSMAYVVPFPDAAEIGRTFYGEDGEVG